MCVCGCDPEHSANQDKNPVMNVKKNEQWELMRNDELGPLCLRAIHSSYFPMESYLASPPPNTNDPISARLVLSNFSNYAWKCAKMSFLDTMNHIYETWECK